MWVGNADTLLSANHEGVLGTGKRISDWAWVMAARMYSVNMVISACDALPATATF